MKYILFALAAVAVLAVGVFVLAPAAHADGGTGGPSTQCTGPNC